MEEWIRSLQEILESAGRSPGLAEYSLLAAAAFLEYVFPPFPGDMVVLFGAFCVGRYSWSPALVLLAVTAGSLGGFLLDYAFGRWVERHDARWRQTSPRWRRIGPSIDRFDASYRRWGAWCIVANRFVPAARAIFFVAAGMARIPLRRVVVLGLVSSLLWNLLLLALGKWVGDRWDRLLDLFKLYSGVAWSLLGAGLLCGAIYFWIRRRRGAGSRTS